MATYAIGDIQGCHQELLALLAHIGFDPGSDRLWFTGDLVSRGPDSLAVLRFVRGLGTRAVSVLGNHDLHLLAGAAGVRAIHPSVRAVTEAPDADALIAWLAGRPLAHHDPASGFTLIHAGLPPAWDLQDTLACAAEVEQTLRGPRRDDFLRHMYGDHPARWDNRLTGHDRLRFITNCLTRARYMTPDGELEFESKGAPGTQPAPLVPWYAIDGRRSRGMRILFGHWSTLRLEPDWQRKHRVYHLDTGCLWGGRLTALRLEDRRFFHIECG